MLVEINSLTKHYRGVEALTDCSLSIESGEVFGLLGPNGSGKTTLVRLLLGFLRPTHGHATIAGLDCQRQSVAVRRQVAYLPGEARLFPQMRGRDVLQFFAEIRASGNLELAMKLAKRLELDTSRRVSFMSTGMRQKLALAATLSSDTRLIVLDEPTANLDPTVRGTVVQLVREARQQGRTIVFSSHVLSEIEDACDRVAILRRGRLVHTQVMTDLRRRHRIHARLHGPLPEVPEQFAGQLSVSRTKDFVEIETPSELSPLLGWLATLPMDEVRIEPLGLRAVYDQFHPPGELPDESRAAEEVCL